MREPIFRTSHARVVKPRRRNQLLSIAISTLVLTASAVAAERSPSELHDTMSDAERSAVISAALASPTGRAVSSREHKMLRMSPAESRAELAQIGKESANAQQKSLQDRSIREVRSGETVTLIVGTALAKQSRLVRDANGQWLRTCGEDHGNGAHAHTHPVAQKGSNRE